MDTERIGHAPNPGRLILASASPRRRELLRLITGAFQAVAVETDETPPAGVPPSEVAEVLARRKAEAGAARWPDCAVIGADTIVVLDGAILGKPRSEAHAREMLSRLSGRSHRVYTGVAVTDRDGTESFTEGAEVRFVPLDAARIDAYVAGGEPMDKAGAYGIQGAGALFVGGITGDFYAVVGLPVCKLSEILRRKYPGRWNL